MTARVLKPAEDMPRVAVTVVVCHCPDGRERTYISGPTRDPAVYRPWLAVHQPHFDQQEEQG